MQSIILAAGLAKRLRPLTDEMPKCLLKIGEKNILHRMVENIVQNGINDFIFVTGYREEMIKSYIEQNFPGINKAYVSNPDYENNNNSFSLWLTKDLVKDDLFLFDSDILFDSKIIGKMLDSKHSNCLAVNKKASPDAEMVKVELAENDRVIEISKEVDLKKTAGESIGIAKFSSYFMRELFFILNRKIVEERNVNEFYEASFQELIDRDDNSGSAGEGRNSIYAVDVSEFNCIEIDTIEDFKNAQRLII
jgi:choline kinase